MLGISIRTYGALAVSMRTGPDHSAKFWLTVQSLCPETERAKQWLSANGLRLAVKLDSVCGEADPTGRHSRASLRRRPGPGGG
jgi:hypothetical protein